MIIMTSMSRAGFDLYGRNMLESFEKHAPCKVAVFHEGFGPDLFYGSRSPIGSRIEWFSFETLVPEMPELRARYHKGNVSNYNEDIERFAPVSMVRARGVGMFSEKVFWFDGDTVARKPIPAEKLDASLPSGFYSSFLGRKDYHTETGFIGFDPTHSGHAQFGKDWEGFYLDGTIEGLQYKHDCGCYDALRARRDSRIFLNLTPRAVKSSHCFVDYWKPYVDHLKGPRRKALGKSPEFVA